MRAEGIAIFVVCHGIGNARKSVRHFGEGHRDSKNAEISRDSNELHGAPREAGAGEVLYKHSEN